jgi:hypothetical protein
MNEYAKAITGAIIAGLGAYGVAVLDGTVTSGEWAGVAVAFLTALGVVWGVPNAPADSSYSRSVTFGGPEGKGPGDGG